MGGASSQVTALAIQSEVTSIPADSKYEVTLHGEQYVLYTHSYLGYGGEKAREAISASLKADDKNLVQDPCLNSGFEKAFLTESPRTDPFDGPSLPGVT